ncbi:hypothetical protein EIP91_010546 [Steccherinum ochraceum]|uniref:Fungal-type protein kinase domain-containing protein n=1 Tax=Steccherinum ochraceum TaxID=92696 RepID=A0A4R0R0H4_9APHY|nr:hypothetical protein EIP91_010546 [Steccherinum ochraceum]
METLPARIPEVDVEWFIQHAVPQVDDRDVKRTADILRRNGTIRDGRWSDYPQDFSKMNGDGAIVGAIVYGHIEDISNAVLAAAAPMLKRRKKVVTARTRSILRQVAKSGPYSIRYRHTSATILEEATISPRLPLADPNNPDHVVNWQFQLRNDFDSIHENRQELLNNAADMMYADPSRRFRYSVSIEDTNMRFWFFSRTVCFATEVFKFAACPKPLIQFLMAVSFASRTELGYDPTVRWVTPNQNEIAYEYTVLGKEGEEHVYRTVGNGIFSHQRHRILGRGTRIWKVREVNAEGEFISDEHVLKDYWLSQNSQTEGEIQAEILSAARKTRTEKGIPCDDISKHFMTILHDTVVTIDGKQDENSVYLPNFHMPPESCGTMEVDLSKIQTYDFYGEIVLRDDPVMTAPSACGDWPKLAGRYYESRKHCRLVFKEVGTPLHQVRSHRLIFQALSFVLEGLKVFYDARFVYRDISMGNLLIWESEDGEVQCKISDLEYARPYLKDLTDEDVAPPLYRTGTPAYMAVEVLSQRHMPLLVNFKRSKADREQRRAERSASKHRSTPVDGVLHNYAHDVEGLWWIGMWTLMYTTTPQLAEQFTDSRFSSTQELEANKIFSPDLSCSLDRMVCLTSRPAFAGVMELLPENFLPACNIMSQARKALFAFYKDLETPLTNARLQDHSRFASLYDEMAPFFARLASEALSEDQVYFHDRRKELKALEQAKADKEAAEEADREAAEEAARQNEEAARQDEEFARGNETAAQKMVLGKRKRRGKAQMGVEDSDARSRALKKSRVSKRTRASASTDDSLEPSMAVTALSTPRITRSSTRGLNAKKSAPIQDPPRTRASTRASAAMAASSKATTVRPQPPKGRGSGRGKK